MIIKVKTGDKVTLIVDEAIVVCKVVQVRAREEDIWLKPSPTSDPESPEVAGSGILATVPGSMASEVDLELAKVVEVKR